MEHIGSLIEAAAQRGIGGTRIARLTGLDRTSWHRWEAGTVQPSPDNLRLVSDALREEAEALAALADRFGRLADGGLSDTVSVTVSSDEALAESAK